MAKKVNKVLAGTEETTVATPVVEEPVETPKKAKKVGLGTLGGIKIAVINERVINGKKFNDVILENGVGYLLSDKDLEAQVK